MNRNGKFFFCLVTIPFLYDPKYRTQSSKNLFGPSAPHINIIRYLISKSQTIPLFTKECRQHFYLGQSCRVVLTTNRRVPIHTYLITVGVFSVASFYRGVCNLNKPLSFSPTLRVYVTPFIVHGGHSIPFFFESNRVPSSSGLDETVSSDQGPWVSVLRQPKNFLHNSDPSPENSRRLVLVTSGVLTDHYLLGPASLRTCTLGAFGAVRPLRAACVSRKNTPKSFRNLCRD